MPTHTPISVQQDSSKEEDPKISVLRRGNVLVKNDTACSSGTRMRKPRRANRRTERRMRRERSRRERGDPTHGRKEVC